MWSVSATATLHLSSIVGLRFAVPTNSSFMHRFGVNNVQLPKKVLHSQYLH